MAQKGVIESRLRLNRADYTQGLKEARDEAVAWAASVRKDLGAPIKLPEIPRPPSLSGRSRVDPVIAEQREQVRLYRDAQNALRTELERGVITNKQYISSAGALQKEMLEFQATLPRLSREWAVLDRAIATAQRGITTASGNISRLGLSQQVAIGLNQQFAQSLAASTGPIGNTALGLVAMGGGLGAVSTGAAIAGGAVLGLSVGTAALVRRGIPEVKEYQRAINTLAESGEGDLGRFRGELTKVQDEGGRAAKAFSRSQLAGALAETVKAGVDATSALTLVRTGTQLASAENENLTESSKLVLQNLRQFDLDATQARRAGDALAKGSQLAAGSARDLSVGLATVGPVGKAAGLTLEETIALLVALDNKGLRAAEEGATGLRSVLSALADPTKEARGVLEGLGVSLEDVDGKTRPARDVLLDLKAALNGNEQAMSAAAKIFDTQGITTILALDESTEEYTRKIRNSEGALVSYADQMTRGGDSAIGLQNAQDRANAAMSDLASTATEIFAPGIAASADATARLLRQLDKLEGFELPTLGQVGDFLTGAASGEQLETATRDLARAREQLRSLREEREKLVATPTTENTRSGLPGFFAEIIGTDEADLEAVLETQDRQIAAFEDQVRRAQARIAALTGGGGSSGGRRGGKPKVEPLPLPIPAVSAEYDAAVKEYEQALVAAQNSAAQAQIVPAGGNYEYAYAA